MADQFKPGDVVRLKSGGPKMTVVSYGDYKSGRMAMCKWFSGNEVKMDTFLDAELQQEN